MPVPVQVPALWMSVMSTRIQEVYSLSGWYADVLRRYEQLAAWTSGSLATPHSVWLSGLFNPKAFLTAVSHTACSCYYAVPAPCTVLGSSYFAL
jgi:hypothetical protein